MIIGISGKSQSGKDTVGKIIQYLNSANYLKYDSTFDQFNDLVTNPDNASSWKIKKFADKLKDMVCLILNCTREQLEDNTFKSTQLGEEWIRYGKADGFFQGGSQGTIMNNASCTKEEYEAELRINWQTAYKFNHTPRSILQMLGTEVGRFIHTDTWVNALFADYKPSLYWMCDRCMDKNITQLIKIPSRFVEQGYLEDEYVCPNCKGEESEGDITQVIDDQGSNWIITDLRFPNELKAIKDHNGITIRVNRDDERSRFMVIDKPEERSKYYHPSETALDDATFDYVIDNNGTIEELIEHVRAIILKENIIK
jgi:hypothetical protein